MRVWLDDERPIPYQPYPSKYDVRVTNYDAAILILLTNTVTFMSFDHDLGHVDAKTGYDVAKFVEKAAHDGTLKPFKWAVHSANPEGAKHIATALRQADKFWRKD